MGPFHHVHVYMGDLHLVYPALNLSVPDAGILKMVHTSKCDDVLLEYGGLPHVLPLAVHLQFIWLDK